MANRFSIDPSAGRDPNALRGLTQAFKDRKAQQQVDAAKSKQTTTQNAAADILKTGDPDKISDFMARNPKYAASMQAASGFKSEATKRNAIKSAIDILGGANPDEVLTARSQAVQAEGGDPADTENLRKLIGGNSEKAKKAAWASLALNTSPQHYKALKEQFGGQVADPLVVGKGASVYDPNTKTYSRPPPVAGDTTLPLVMRKGLSDPVADQGEAAFNAAGGGKDGVKAFNEAVVIAKEDERRSDAYESLAISYPNVSPEEMSQLQTAIDTAPTVEKGMALAEKVRTNQRAAEKAAVMSDRSLDLVNHILANDELEDVIGSSEGKFGGSEQPSGALPLIGGFISDSEATAIADIEEITNILTVPAMDLMTGILSESDLKLLKTISGGAFNRTRSIERFKSDVGQIQRILQTASVIGKLAPKDREAAVWATDKKNMNKPQARAIIKKLGLPNGQI